ncbi:Cupin_1 domain-containing protein, partial [Cephalotus follicularis]
MGFKIKLSLAILLISFWVLCALATKDPELKQCRHQCRHQRQFDEQEQRECEQRCEDSIKQKKERERREEEEFGRGNDHEWNLDDSQKQVEQCQKQCERQSGEPRQLCRFRCQEKWKREQGREGESYRRREREEEEEEQEENPYVFGDEHFTSRVETEHGRVDVLQRFNKLSKLLRGLENYRVAILEANPQTFVLPHHIDANCVLFVAKGRATLTMVREKKRESFNLECGDILNVPSGTPLYITNRDENEKLYILKLLQPVNTPDTYKAYTGLGGENPESFFRAFSNDILEAALKTDRSSLDKLFRQQRQGAIVKASKQQIEAMSQSEEGGGGIWPFAGETSRGPFNMFKHRQPSQHNNFGQLFEVHPHDYRPLKDLNLMVSFANISRGAMIGPYFNSKATKISIVVGGEGYFEMACPHVSSSRSRREGSGPRYQKIRSQLQVGTVFVVPSGHPIATVASNNNNLQILCFEVNAQGNFRYPLAGR